MRAIQTRCMKCGTVFTSTLDRVLHCTCCYADESYLKRVLTNADAPAACLTAEAHAAIDSRF